MRRVSIAPLLLLSACVPRITGVVRRPEASLLTLAEKAERYRAELEARHRTAQGLLRPSARSDEAAGQPRPAAARFGGLADQAAYSGALLAAEAWRYSVTGAEEAAADARRTARGLVFLERVTGERGYLARGVCEGPAQDDRFRPGAPPFEAYAWRHDSSRDQYAWVLFGIATALARCRDPLVLAEVAPLAGDMADHVFENDLEIREAGRKTTYGELSGRILGLVPNGVNAGIVLLAARAAAVATGEARHAERYAALVRDGWPRRVRSGFFRILGAGNPNNDHMTLFCLDGLLLLETDPELRATYLRALEKGWRMARGQGNGLVAAVAWRHLGEQADGAFEEAVEALRLFPAEKIRWATDNRDLLDAFGRDLLPGKDFRPRTRRPVPLHRRAPSSFLWASDPFVVVEAPAADGNERLAGFDYLLVYWMLRGSGLGAEE